MCCKGAADWQGSLPTVHNRHVFVGHHGKRHGEQRSDSLVFSSPRVDSCYKRNEREVMNERVRLRSQRALPCFTKHSELGICSSSRSSLMPSSNNLATFVPDRCAATNASTCQSLRRGSANICSERTFFMPLRMRSSKLPLCEPCEACPSLCMPLR